MTDPVARLEMLADHRPDALADGPTFPRGDSAVLLLVVLDTAEPGVLLTRRAGGLRTDPGFVAFPGGRLEPGETAEAAAARECEEETGVAASAMTVRGRLDASWNGAGFRILPIVATVPGPVGAVVSMLAPHAAEVADARVVSLARLADPGAHHIETTSVDGHDFADDVIELDEGWRLYGPSAGIAVDLVDWLQGGDGPEHAAIRRERRARRRVELAHFAAHRW